MKDPRVIPLKMTVSASDFSAEGDRLNVIDVFKLWLRAFAPHGHPRPGPAVTLGLTVHTEGVRYMLTLTDTQKVTLSVDPRDAKGKPAKLDGAPVWTSSADAVAAVTPSDDGLSAVVVAGDPGDAQITVTADARLGDEVVPLTGTLDIQVLAGEAVTLSVNAGAPEEQ